MLKNIASLGLSRTVCEIDGDFRRKLQNFLTLLFCTPLKCRGTPWNWVSVLGIKKLEWWCYRADKEVRRCLDTIRHMTDKWTPGNSKDRAYA